MPLYGIYRMILEVVGHDQTGGIFRRVTGGLASIFQYATAIVGAQIFYRLSEGIASMVSQSVEAVAWFQNLEIALATLVAREMVQTGAARTVGDAFGTAQIKAGELAEQLSAIAILSPYTVESTTQTYKMAMAFGYTTDEAMTFTNALLNTAAGIGADNNMLDRMAYNLAQVRLQGKVTALDIRQLALAGFDLNAVLKYTGEQMGINIEDHLDFNKALEEGKITWADFTKYFAQYADEMFGGASERMSRTLFGLKSTFHDVFVLTMPKLLGPAAESITAFLNEVLNKFMVFRTSGQLESWAQNIKLWVDTAIMVLKGLLSPDISAKGKWKLLLKMLFPQADADKIVNTMEKVWNTIKVIWNAGTNFIGEVIGVIKELFGELMKFWDAYGPQITSVVQGAFDIFMKVIGWLRDNWKTVLLFAAAFKTVVGVISTVSKWFKVISLVIAGLSSPITLIAGLIALLAVAWQKDWGGIREKVQVVWDWLRPILEEKIPIAVQWATDVWNNTLLPAIQAVWGWLSGTFIPWVAGTLIPWFQTNIPLAIQTVSNFWNNTLLPALNAVWNFLQTYIIPVLMAVGGFITNSLGNAVQIISAIWNNLLLPAFQAAWNFIQTYIIPAFQNVADFLGPIIGAAIDGFKNFLDTVLIPALQRAWDMFNDNILPIIQVVIDIFTEITDIVGQAFAGFWENILLPAITKVYDFFQDNIMPVLTTVRDFILDHVGPAIVWLNEEVFAPLVEALQTGLQEALQWFYDILVKIKDFFAGFTLPPWLTGRSPTPFQIGLEGINTELDTMYRVSLPRVNNALRGLRAPNNILGGINSVMRAGGGGVIGANQPSGNVYVTVPIDSINNDVDIDRLAYKVASTIQRKRSYGQ